MPDWYKIKKIYVGQNLARPLVPATAISLNQAYISLTSAWQTSQLVATLTPADSTSKVTWTSSNTSIATVSSTWLVTCVTPWNATITATTNNWLTATCAVQSITIRDFTTMTSAEYNNLFPTRGAMSITSWTWLVETAGTNSYYYSIRQLTSSWRSYNCVEISYNWYPWGSWTIMSAWIWDTIKTSSDGVNWDNTLLHCKRSAINYNNKVMGLCPMSWDWNYIWNSASLSSTFWTLKFKYNWSTGAFSVRFNDVLQKSWTDTSYRANVASKMTGNIYFYLCGVHSWSTAIFKNAYVNLTAE